MPAPFVDPRQVLAGYKGELFLLSGEKFAECNTWKLSANLTNEDYQPAGSSLSVAILQSVSFTMTLTETVIKDARLIAKFLSRLPLGRQPTYSFQGVLRGNDDTQSRITIANAVPDGAVDILNVAPGATINREWNFRVNTYPVPTSLLGPIVAGDLVDNFEDLIV